MYYIHREWIFYTKIVANSARGFSLYTINKKNAMPTNPEKKQTPKTQTNLSHTHITKQKCIWLQYFIYLNSSQLLDTFVLTILCEACEHTHTHKEIGFNNTQNKG